MMGADSTRSIMRGFEDDVSPAGRWRELLLSGDLRIYLSHPVCLPSFNLADGMADPRFECYANFPDFHPTSTNERMGPEQRT